VLKLPGSQANFYTAASTLGDAGYTSYFIYGGEAHFDNMSGFFLNNGFDKVIDQNDYIDSQFSGTWGVSDQDLFAKADETLRQSKTPTFIVAFTSSFHSPYEFPDDQIVLVDEPKETKRNAIKYADHALGADDSGRAIMQYGDNHAYMSGDYVIIHRPELPQSGYIFEDEVLRPAVYPQELGRIAHAWALLQGLLYRDAMYGAAPEESSSVE
jgi:hypothetical protein